MKYSLSETKERQSQREHRRNLRTVHHHIALFPGTAVCVVESFSLRRGTESSLITALQLLSTTSATDVQAPEMMLVASFTKVETMLTDFVCGLWEKFVLSQVFSID